MGDPRSPDHPGTRVPGENNKEKGVRDLIQYNLINSTTRNETSILSFTLPGPFFSSPQTIHNTRLGSIKISWLMITYLGLLAAGWPMAMQPAPCIHRFQTRGSQASASAMSPLTNPHARERIPSQSQDHPDRMPSCSFVRSSDCHSVYVRGGRPLLYSLAPQLPCSAKSLDQGFSVVFA